MDAKSHLFFSSSSVQLRIFFDLVHLSHSFWWTVASLVKKTKDHSKLGVSQVDRISISSFHTAALGALGSNLCRSPRYERCYVQELELWEQPCSINCTSWTFLYGLVQVQLPNVRAYVTLRQKKERREKRGRNRSYLDSFLLILPRGKEWLKYNLCIGALILLIIILLITRPVISQYFYHPLFSLYSPKSQGPIEWVLPYLKFFCLSFLFPH